jgi:hypothetical protein
MSDGTGESLKVKVKEKVVLRKFDDATGELLEEIVLEDRDLPPIEVPEEIAKAALEGKE